MWILTKTPSVLGQSVIAIGLWTLTLAAFTGLGFFARKVFLRVMEDLKSNKADTTKLDDRVDTMSERLASIEKNFEIEKKLAFVEGRQSVLVEMMAGIGPEYMQSIKEDTKEHCQASLRSMDRKMEQKMEKYVEESLGQAISAASKE